MVIRAYFEAVIIESSLLDKRQIKMRLTFDLQLFLVTLEIETEKLSSMDRYLEIEVVCLAELEVDFFKIMIRNWLVQCVEKINI